MHSNPLVATGVLPTNLYNSFIFLEMNQPKQKQPRVVTKSHLLTSDEHVQMYDKKVSKKGKQKKPNKKGKMSVSKGKQKKNSWKSKAVESGQEEGLERKKVEFEHVVEREIGSTYHQKNHPQKKK